MLCRRRPRRERGASERNHRPAPCSVTRDGFTFEKQVQGVMDAVGSILHSFEKTDQDALNNLDTGGGP